MGADYTITVHVRGHTYMPVSGIADSYHQSKSTVERFVKEILETDRYKGYRPVINDDGYKLINVLIYEDYLSVKGKLKEKNLARHLEPFSPADVRKNWGEYAVVTSMEGKQNEPPEAAEAIKFYEAMKQYFKEGRS